MKNEVVCVLVACLLWGNPSGASEYDRIKARCKSQMGEYGASMVKACLDQDVEALSALSKYPPKAKPIIARCTRQMAEYGWTMVKACVDQDIAAAKSMGDY